MTRTSLTRYAPLAQEPQPMTEHDKRELGRRLWHQHGALCVMPGWAPQIIWQACEVIARRLYGERRA
jgi:hypothetical protein